MSKSKGVNPVGVSWVGSSARWLIVYWQLTMVISLYNAVGAITKLFINLKVWFLHEFMYISIHVIMVGVYLWTLAMENSILSGVIFLISISCKLDEVVSVALIKFQFNSLISGKINGIFIRADGFVLPELGLPLFIIMAILLLLVNILLALHW